MTEYNKLGLRKDKPIPEGKFRVVSFDEKGPVIEKDCDSLDEARSFIRRRIAGKAKVFNDQGSCVWEY
jgi:hypothetical protein